MPSDYKLYAPNWLTEIRPAILERAGAIPDEGVEANCEWCGRQNHSRHSTLVGDHYKISRTVLTIAHLDQDVQNNDYANLAALCQRCHLLWDRPWHLINASLTRDRNKRQTLLPDIDPNDWRNHVKEKKLTHSFNILLGDAEVSMLKKMSDESSTNMSIIIRQSIKWRYLIQIDKVPTCGNGRACMVPHMHVTPAG